MILVTNFIAAREYARLELLYEMIWLVASRRSFPRFSVFAPQRRYLFGVFGGRVLSGNTLSSYITTFDFLRHPWPFNSFQVALRCVCVCCVCCLRGSRKVPNCFCFCQLLVLLFNMYFNYLSKYINWYQLSCHNHRTVCSFQTKIREININFTDRKFVYLFI